MYTNRLYSDFEIWINHLIVKSERHILDFSALNRLLSLIKQNPDNFDDFSNVFAQRISSFGQQHQTQAVYSLHILNTIIMNLRLFSKPTDDIDVLFLSKLLNSCLSPLTNLLNFDWKYFRYFLGMTLFEWKINYKIESFLGNEHSKLIKEIEKDESEYKNVHHSLFQNSEKLQLFYQLNLTDPIANSILRVLIQSNNNPEAKRQPFIKKICLYDKYQGQQIIQNLLKSYIEITTRTQPDRLLKNKENNCLRFLNNLIQMNSASFLEASISPILRILIERLQGSTDSQLIKSEFFRQCVNELVASIQYNIENLHKNSSHLSWIICTVIQQIQRCKNCDNEWWNELLQMLVFNVISPAVSNPVKSGVLQYADIDTVQFLNKIAKLIENIFIGQQFTKGELKDVDWLKEQIPIWNQAIKESVRRQLITRKSVPNDLAIPKALLIWDLMQIQDTFAFEWTLSPQQDKVSKNFNRWSLGYIKTQEISEEYFSPQTAQLQNRSQSEFQLQLQTQFYLEDNSKQHVDQDFQNVSSKMRKEQQENSQFQPFQGWLQYCDQTPQFSPQQNVAKESQTEFVEQRNAEVQTDVKYKQMLQIIKKLQYENANYRKYQQKEEERNQQVHNYWVSQYQELQKRNYLLQSEIRQLKKQVVHLEKPKVKKQKSLTHLSLRNRIKERFNISDVEVDSKCDPHFYLQLSSRLTSPTNESQPRLSFGESLSQDLQKVYEKYLFDDFD